MNSMTGTGRLNSRKRQTACIFSLNLTHRRWQANGVNNCCVQHQNRMNRFAVRVGRLARPPFDGGAPLTFPAL